MFKVLDVVELTHDIKEYNLEEGKRGTIVEIYKEGEAYEVEFIAPDGKTSVLLTLMQEDIRPIFNRGVYQSHGLNAPVYFSTVTVSGTAVKDINTLNLGIKTEIHKNKANTEAFYYPAITL